MVGDSKQMIYGFNGSSKECLCKHFVDDFSPQQFELKENYRSTKAVIKAANRLRPDSQIEIEYALEGDINISEFDTEEAEADSVALTIKHLLDLKAHVEIEGEISLNKIVVIARNRFLFGRLENSLKEKAIPYSLRKGERQLETSTRFSKALDYAVRVKLNPKDWVDGKKLCQVLSIAEPKSWTAATLSNMATQVASAQDDNSELLAKLLSAIDELDIGNPNIPKIVREFDGYLTSLVENQSDVPDDKFEDVKLSLKELKEFNSAWTRFKSKGLGDSLVAFRNALALGHLSENSINDCLTLSTVYTMKGLEKDIVFLIGMCEGVFPDYRANTAKELQ